MRAPPHLVAHEQECHPEPVALREPFQHPRRGSQVAGVARAAGCTRKGGGEGGGELGGRHGEELGQQVGGLGRVLQNFLERGRLEGAYVAGTRSERRPEI
jgi:hypothetical protein